MLCIIVWLHRLFCFLSVKVHTDFLALNFYPFSFMSNDFGHSAVSFIPLSMSMVKADIADSSKPLHYANFLFGYIKGRERKVWSQDIIIPLSTPNRTRNP